LIVMCRQTMTQRNHQLITDWCQTMF